MKKRTKKTLSVSGKVFLRLILATVLCAIVYFSMLTIATAMFSDVIGYQIYDQETEVGTNYYFADGAVPKSELELPDTMVMTDLREVSPKTLGVFQVISQVLMLAILAIFPYHILWAFGNRDDTNVRYKGQRLDPYRGFRIGAFAIMPYVLMWLLLVVAKYGILPDGYAQVYRLANIFFMPYVNWVMPAASVQSTELWRLFALLPMYAYVPVVCGVAYRFGHKQFSIRERLVFAKKKSEEGTEI